MPFDAGTNIGPYQITGLVGEGGMGQVYRAHDTRLRRDVAIKFSSERFSERFEREARAAAALNHPNVCTLFDVGPNYLVMELVDGPTLAERIRQGTVPMQEALSIARQIAEALKAAHEAGIVHRDLKPANIKLKPDGSVKVLDFGLAKMAAQNPDVSPQDSPTLSFAQATGAGIILGTAAYMSPEQARGKTADKRSDIWSFGVVLYELLTGQRLFDGETVSDILAAVLTKEPDLNRTPAEARVLLQRCLTRDPKLRLQDIGDAMPLVESERPAVASRSRAAMAGWAVAVVLAAGLGFSVWLPSRSTPERPQSLQFQIPAPRGTKLLGGAIVSPDGTNVAMTATGDDGKSRLWIRSLDSFDARLLADTETQDVPFWSFDSKFLVYTSTDGRLKKIDVRGGSPQTLTDLQGGILGGSWNSDGQIIFFSFGTGSLMQVSASGGQLSTLIDGSSGVFPIFPHFLPDGRHFIYTDLNTTIISSLDASPSKPPSQGMALAKDGTANVMYVPSVTSGSGYLLFVHGTTLMAQHFDDRQLKLTGEPVPVADKVDYFWASRNAIDYWKAPLANYQPTWVDVKGKTLGTVAEAGPYLGVRISPDATQAAIAKRVEATFQVEIWLVDLIRKTKERFVSRKGVFNTRPVWSADGEWVAYAASELHTSAIYRKPIRTGKDEEVLLRGSESASPSSWSKDGRYLLFDVYTPKNGTDIVIAALDNGSPDSRKQARLAATSFNESGAVFSPDEQWIAYVSDESGQPEIYARSFMPGAVGELPKSGPRFPVSIGGGTAAYWRADSKQLIYTSPNGDLMSADLSNDPARPFGQPKLVRKALAGASVGDVTSDGRSLVLAQVGQKENSDVSVIVNWQSRLP
jgi:serine/threonine protein kinase